MRNTVISEWKDFGGKKVIKITQLHLHTVVRVNKSNCNGQISSSKAVRLYSPLFLHVV
jgi:hypothetical protein